jgi:hypothetical protein
MNSFVVKDTPGFRLSVKSWKCVNPNNLNALEFVQETKTSTGEVDMSSTYQFFMTDDEVVDLCNGLLDNVINDN